MDRKTNRRAKLIQVAGKRIRDHVPLFKELTIDYCCGGKSLETACRQRDLDPEIILEKIRKLIEPG